jgi:rhodanese-related sulfurtransferase
VKVRVAFFSLFFTRRARNTLGPPPSHRMACSLRATVVCVAGRLARASSAGAGRRAAAAPAPPPMRRPWLARVLSSSHAGSTTNNNTPPRYPAPPAAEPGAAPSTPPPPSADFPGRLVRVSHILLRPETADPAGRLDALERLARAGGLDAFAAAARAESACPSGASAGGDLGWVARGATVPAFEEAAFACGLGAFARAVTEFGHHLLTVTEEKAGPVPVRQMGVLDLKALLESGGMDAETAEAVAAGADPPAGSGAPPPPPPLQLVDVREEGEFATATIPGFHLRPLSAFDPDGLDPAAMTIVLCHHGVRSQRVANFLVSECGFTNVWNVSGGIDAYARLADRSVPLY